MYFQFEKHYKPNRPIELPAIFLSLKKIFFFIILFLYYFITDFINIQYRRFAVQKQTQVQELPSHFRSIILP